MKKMPDELKHYRGPGENEENEDDDLDADD